MSKEKLIICSGDSFTAGDELAGDLLVPNYTKNLYKNLMPTTEERSKVFKQLEAETMKLWYNYTEKTKYENECKKRAWPAYLEKNIDNTDVINCAAPGLSNEEIVYRAIETYFKLKNSYEPKNIRIIIMATTFTRFGVPVHEPNSNTDYDYRSYTANHIKDHILPKYIRPEFENFFMRYNDYDKLMRSMSALCLGKNFFETNNIKIYFVDSCLWDRGLTAFDAEYEERILYFENIIPLLCKMSELKITNVLAGFHYPEEVHKDFADLISKLI